MKAHHRYPLVVLALGALVVALFAATIGLVWALPEIVATLLLALVLFLYIRHSPDPHSRRWHAHHDAPSNPPTHSAHDPSPPTRVLPTDATPPIVLQNYLHDHT